MTTTTRKTESKSKPTKDKVLPKRLRIGGFLVPAAVGFLLAYMILLIMGPYTTTIEWLSWLLIAIVVSLAASVVTGDIVRSAIRRTRLYRDSSRFDTEVDQLFGTYLREGSVRTLRKEAVRHGHDLQFIDDVVEQLDALTKHDRLTRGHAERVRAYASLIGVEIGLAQPELELLNWTALLHDIGKIEVPASILNSPGKPTAEEWAVLRKHPQAAKGRLDKLERVIGEGIYDGALYHHERWDGNGYPKGLAQGSIPLFGRITAIADAFDVMTSTRSYKSAMSISEAREELMASAGTQFDPDLVTAFVRIGDQDLKDVRGWSATFAGITVAGSGLLTATTNAALAGTTLAGAAIATATVPQTAPPEAIAFFESSIDEAENGFDTAASTADSLTADDETTVVADATTTTIGAVTTTTIQLAEEVEQRLMTVTYQLSSNIVDGVEVNIDPDQLVLYIGGELHSTVDLVPNQQFVAVTFDVTGLPEQGHLVRFELYDEGELVSVDETVLFG